eukprot:scaffold15405_cov119-Isochrysis_galbana.AAC.3
MATATHAHRSSKVQAGAPPVLSAQRSTCVCSCLGSLAPTAGCTLNGSKKNLDHNDKNAKKWMALTAMPRRHPLLRQSARRQMASPLARQRVRISAALTILISPASTRYEQPPVSCNDDDMPDA